MSKKIRKIKYSKERVVLSDILPYEMPITFSNRHFYNFLVDNQIEFVNNSLIWKKDDDILDQLIKFIFQINGNIQIEGNKKRININVKEPYKINFLETIPFSFRISHKEHEFRELILIHPANQLSVVNFYNRYQNLILYYCSVSPYSIRKPYKIAKFTYFNDTKHKQNKAEEPERTTIELFGQEYENLKTYFAYEEYSNIHDFYESYTYQRNEKKFNKLFKFDITKCFDSIYTHSLSWALLNKEIVKENIDVNDFTFGGAFDRLMQKLNYNETNGIVIGPEFSRIFAEILLQQIDFTVFQKLKNKDIKNNVNYTVFRYVDDYFLFYNDDNIKNEIIELFKIELKKYKLYVSEAKSFLYNKPIITELTIAKERISEFLNNYIKLEIVPIEPVTNQDNNEENDKSNKYSFYFNDKKAIIGFKTIIKETGIEYKDILNYTLAVIDKKIFGILKKYDKAKFENKNEEVIFTAKFIKAIIELIDFTMFLYSVSPRVNTTIKLCTILVKLTKFIKLKTGKSNPKEKYFNLDQKNLVFKKIFDDISLVLNKNKNSENTQVESFYLLIALQDLGHDYRLDKETLRKYLGIIVLESGDFQFPYSFNYWSISVLLFYIRDLKRYEKIRGELIKHIKEKFQKADKNNIGKYAELVILALDLLSCPFLENNFKREVLGLCSINNNKTQIIDRIEKRKDWFTKWNNFDFEMELNTKRSQEVY